MNKFTYNPNRPIEEIKKLNKKSRIVPEPISSFYFNKVVEDMKRINKTNHLLHIDS